MVAGRSAATKKQVIHALFDRVATVCRAAGSLVIPVRKVLRPAGIGAGVFGEIQPFFNDGFFDRDSAGIPPRPAH